MNNYRIRGKRKGDKKGGVYFGISMDDNLPVFGGGKLIHAPIYWNMTQEEAQSICYKMQENFPECEFYLEILN